MIDKAQLETSIAEAHRRLYAAVAGFDATILETDPVAGVWSPRDVFGHLADWHNETVDAIGYALAGQQFPRPIRDIETYNTAQAALRGIETWEQVVADLKNAQARVLDALHDVDAPKLRRTGQLPWGRVEQLGGFFESIARHTLSHAEELEHWRLRKLGVRE